MNNRLAHLRDISSDVLFASVCSTTTTTTSTVVSVLTGLPAIKLREFAVLPRGSHFCSNKVNPAYGGGRVAVGGGGGVLSSIVILMALHFIATLDCANNGANPPEGNV